tara:strand:+ start:415 stop:738 length:324 start_codon:yes stop_codon:yes gene_type:complete
MIDAYKKLWTKAFDFRGCSNRSDYWWGVLANLLVSYLLAALGAFVSETFYGIYYIYIFAALIPGLSLSIRRVRDAGKSWQWIFINLIPLAGGIWFIVILCQPSIKVV